MPSLGGTLTRNIPHGPFPSATTPHLNTVAAMRFGEVKHPVPSHQPPAPQWRVTDERLVDSVGGASCSYRAPAGATSGSRGKGRPVCQGPSVPQAGMVKS